MFQLVLASYLDSICTVCTKCVLEKTVLLHPLKLYLEKGNYEQKSELFWVLSYSRIMAPKNTPRLCRRKDQGSWLQMIEQQHTVQRVSK